MRPLLVHHGILTGVAALVLVSAPVRAADAPGPIRDDGKFFSKAGLDSARRKIRAIQTAHRKSAVVETVEGLTEEQEKEANRIGRPRFFNKLAADRAAARKVAGVYIFICKDPKNVTIVADPESRKGFFTAEVHKRTFDRLVRAFAMDQNDKGLLDALDGIEAALKAGGK